MLEQAKSKRPPHSNNFTAQKAQRKPKALIFLALFHDSKRSLSKKITNFRNKQSNKTVKKIYKTTANTNPSPNSNSGATKLKRNCGREKRMENRTTAVGSAQFHAQNLILGDWNSVSRVPRSRGILVNLSLLISLTQEIDRIESTEYVWKGWCKRVSKHWKPGENWEREE